MSILTQPRRPVNAKSTVRPLDVSLMLTINSQGYDVTPLANAPGALRSYRLAKVGGDGAVYDIDAFGDRITCACPSYSKSHAGTSSLCKHGRAMVMTGLVDHPDVAEVPATGPLDAYNDHREKLAAIVESEAVVRSESEAVVRAESEAPEDRTNLYDPLPARVVVPFDAELYRCQSAVASGRALWVSHRHLHTSEPMPVRMTPCSTEGGGDDIRFVDDDGTPLETSREMDARHRAEDAAKVAELMTGNPFLPAARETERVPCCDPAESMPCQACVNVHTLPDDLSGDDWEDGGTWELGPETDPFDGWIQRQADAYAKIKTPRAAWLAAKIASLAERAKFLDADSPDAFDDRLEASLDAARDAAEARASSRGGC